MKVFIGNLPPEFSTSDLLALGQLPATVPVRIHKKPDGNGGRHRYGLVQLDSDRAGRQLIHRLQGCLCRGHTLTVHEYVHRRTGNERRRLDWRQVPRQGPERRVAERRVAN